VENGTYFKNGSDVKNGSIVNNGSRQYLTFRVARQDLALDAERVRAIVPMRELVPMASARAGVIGVVNLAGHAVVVVDLRVRLWKRGQTTLSTAPSLQMSTLVLAGTEQSVPFSAPHQSIVVVEAAGGHLAGFLVDRVTDVIRYRSRDLRQGILRGVGRPRRVVEVDQLVAEDDLVRLWSVSL
jgi:chemotaxis signal transduction protein